jgi:hypothetical protein
MYVHTLVSGKKLTRLKLLADCSFHFRTSFPFWETGNVGWLMRVCLYIILLFGMFMIYIFINYF